MKIEITVKNYRCFSEEAPAKFIIADGLTAFVGPNNAGKSTALKLFYEFRDLFDLLISNQDNIFENMFKANQSLHRKDMSRNTSIFNNSTDNDLHLSIKCLDLEIEPTKKYINSITLELSKKVYGDRLSCRVDSLSTPTGEIKFGQKTPVHLRDPETLTVNQKIYDLKYLRKALSKLHNTLYVGPFRNITNSVSNDPYFDIQLGKSFIEQLSVFISGDDKKQNELFNELSEAIKHIFGYKELKINVSDDRTTLRLLINGKSYALEELGTGIAQFILMLANAALKKPNYILIDEPETSLHPSLQLDLITTLASYSTDGVIFSTHNMGLAKSSADKIYGVMRSDDCDYSTVKDFDEIENLSLLLGELCFNGYRELGFDKILLVEGKTDIKTMHQFLRLYNTDHRITLLPLSGTTFINANCTEALAEITKITDKIFAIIDSEKTSETDEISVARKTFKSICEDLDINCHILDRRATENYLTDAAVKKVKGKERSALENFAKIEDSNIHWRKEDNWRIAREMTIEDLDNTDLGDFLKNL